jgi:hypothetical protein
MQIRSVGIDLGKTTFHLVAREGANRRDPHPIKTASPVSLPLRLQSSFEVNPCAE